MQGHWRISLEALIRDSDNAYVSAITLYELEYGARASDFARIERAFRPTVLPLGRAEAEQAAKMNGALACKNQQIGPLDAPIAGAALPLAPSR